MLYGAYGFTGRLIARAAIARGHKPMLAGRNESKLRPMAEAMGLPWQAVSLDQPQELRQLLDGRYVVINAAGPFIHTHRPLVDACLSTGTHYLDITGEMPVFESIYALDHLAREHEIAMIPGAAFDVVPTDCLALYLAQQMPQAEHLELAVASTGSYSAGTLQTILEHFGDGGYIRRNGSLVPFPLAAANRRVRFSNLRLNVTAAPLPDLASAYRSTHIPNIKTYRAMSRASAGQLRVMAPGLKSALRIKPVRRVIQSLVPLWVPGPDDKTQQEARTYVWGSVSDRHGNSQEARLESIEAYRMTSLTTVMAAEELMQRPQMGSLTPAQAFGADFMLQLPETKRYD